MVSLKIFRLRSDCPLPFSASRFSRLSGFWTLGVIALLMILCTSPASADDSFTTQLCETPGIDFTASLSAAGPYPVTVHFEAKESGCTNCQWTWTVGRPGWESATYEDTYHYPNMLDYTFVRPGRYNIDVEVFVPDQCNGYKAISHARHEIEVTGPALGGEGACLIIDNNVHTLTPAEARGEMGRSPEFFADAARCAACDYSWIIYKLDGDSIQGRRGRAREIPLSSGDIIPGTNNQRITHDFQEGGTYEIISIVNNPPACPKDMFNGGEHWTEVYYNVAGSEGYPGEVFVRTTPTTYPSLSPPPEVTTAISPTMPLNPSMTPVPGRTYRPTGEGVKELVPITTQQTLANLPPGRGGGAPTLRQRDGVPVGETTASATSPTTATTTRSPGFELPLVVGAWLVALVMFRK
jgi:hypothetical protein